jgi:hypothetical protein
MPLTRSQAAAMPLLAHLDTARWVLLAAALVGIVAVIRARISDWRQTAALKHGPDTDAGTRPAWGAFYYDPAARA